MLTKKDFMDYVRTIYPNAVEVYFFDTVFGKELIFSPSETNDAELSCTVSTSGHGFEIVEDF